MAEDLKTEANFVKSGHTSATWNRISHNTASSLDVNLFSRRHCHLRLLLLKMARSSGQSYRYRLYDRKLQL